MKIINSFTHGIIDYFVVIFLLASPTLFGLTGLPATITYALGIIHLLLTIFTSFQLGLFKIIPFKIHGIIELLVSFVLIPLPWMLGFSQDLVARNFFVGFGIAVFLTWLFTDYILKIKRFDFQ